VQTAANPPSRNSKSGNYHGRETKHFSSPLFRCISPMKIALRLLAIATVCSCFAPFAQAQNNGTGNGNSSWLFQRSYYSHDPVTDVRIGRPTVSGGPYYTRPVGAYIKSGFRNLNSVINVGNAGADITNVWESWIQTGEQF
jgi:hypothetical protein